ncbi:hypothetical protein [Rhizomonospora bruguierae]|uniref:hypothetical protein n=1 Tax=Rhizomonospora bruguierae TaxID=1581705 RepID=UPI001BCF7114|nr:hypothetical protein [Micromonospora sp. NBRC 107566]
MSEYQYYEFVAIDRPLTDRQVAELRELSPPARVTRTSFIGAYDWADFTGDVRQLIAELFDAHLHLTNWGTRQVLFRVPAGVLELDTAVRYCEAAWADGDGVILDFTQTLEDTGEDWATGGEGRLAPILPVRAELLAGDLRALYLGWLVAVQADEVAGEAVEPPVPAGLRELTPAQRSLAEFLCLDPDLLAAAAEGSGGRDGTAPAARPGARTAGQLRAAAAAGA